ncbi:MAG: adenosine deaminase [Spirochaetes bacterium]|nr:adenosine deaminase [Spirochaetota bacterium]
MDNSKIELNVGKEILLNKDTIKKFPKVELHRHLEGTMPLETLYEISKKNKIGLPDNFEDFKKEVQFPSDSKPDFLLFLSKFRNNYYKTYKDIEILTYNAIKSLKEENIFYIELRFSPEHYSIENNFDRKEITKLIINIGNKAAKEEGINIKYLLTFNRNKQNQDEMIELYDKLKDVAPEYVVGIDLAGDELNYPPKLFTKFFNIVFNDNLYKITVHAGEVTDSKQIWDAIFYLYASRIGHGVATIEDKELQIFLKDNRIYLEQCIISNKLTGSWENDKTHPFGELFRKGIPVTLNSDDPIIQNSILTDEYIKVIENFDFTLEDLINLNLNTIEASFLNEKEKSVLKNQYILEVNKFIKNYIKTK